FALQRNRRAEADLDPLRGGLADEEAVGPPHELDDGLIQLVAPGPDRRVTHDTRQRDDRDVGGSAADVDDHAADQSLHRQAYADRRGHRFSHHEQALDPGRLGRVAHGAALDLGDPGRDADHHGGLDPQDGPVDHHPEEMAQHLFGDMEIGDDPVLHGAHRQDTFRSAAQHPLGLQPDAQDVAGGLIDGGDRRLVQHDPFAL